VAPRRSAAGRALAGVAHRAPGIRLRLSGHRPQGLALAAAGLGLGGLAAAVALADGGYFVGSAGLLAIGAMVAVAALLIVAPAALPATGPFVLAALGLAGLVGAMAVSVAWSPAPSLGWLEVTKGIAYLGVFTAAALIVRRRSAAEGVLAGVVAGGGLLALGTLLAVAARDDPRGDLFYNERLAGPVGYQNGFATIMVAAALAAVVAMAAPVASRWGIARRILAFGALGLVVCAGAASQSRGAALGLAAGLVLIVAVHPRRLRLLVPLAALAGAAAAAAGPAVELRDGVAAGAAPAAAAADALRGRAALVVAVLLVAGAASAAAERLARGRPAWMRLLRRAGIVVTAATAVALVGLVAINAGAIAERADSPLEGIATPDGAPETGQRYLSVSGSGRLELWDKALSAVADRPVTGQGAGGFSIWWNIHRERASPDTLYAHSLPLSIAADAGVLGLAAFGAWLAGVAWAAVALIRRRPSLRGHAAALVAVVAAWLVSAGFDWFWSLPAATVAAMAAAGAVVGLGAGPPARAGGRRVTRLRRSVALLLVGVAAAGIVVAARPFLADRALDRAAAIGVADPSLARAQIDRAEWLESRDPRIDELRARISYGLGDNRRARRELAEGTRRNPLYFVAWERLGSFEERVLNRPRAAHAALSRALELHFLDLEIRDRVRDLEERIEGG
jgi:O-antigen ligase